MIDFLLTVVIDMIVKTVIRYLKYLFGAQNSSICSVFSCDNYNK